MTEQLITIFNEISEVKIEDKMSAFVESKENEIEKIDVSLTNGWIRDSCAKFGKVFYPEFKGPKGSNSNWIVRGRILVGGYPEYQSQLDAIKRAGITTFVCLNVEYGTFNPKRDNSYPRYGDDLEYGKFIHFPIKDMNITQDELGLIDLCEELKKLVLSGENIYIHCSGGHGRTGTVTALLLKLLFQDLTTCEIFDYIQCMHDQREYYKYGSVNWAKWIDDDKLQDQFVPGQVPSPQASCQRNQVIKLTSLL